RGENAVEHHDVILTDPVVVEPRAIRIEVLADRRHRQRILAEELQVVRDIRRAASELPPEPRHEKGHVQDMDLVREDVILERILEDHDVVVGYGAADQCRHVPSSQKGASPLSRDKKRGASSQCLSKKRDRPRSRRVEPILSSGKGGSGPLSPSRRQSSSFSASTLSVLSQLKSGRPK